MAVSRPTHSGVVPFLIRDDVFHTVLITNTQGKWGFPKGFIDPGDTGPEAAVTEAREEAGLLGEIHDAPFTKYTQAKWGEVYLVEMYLFRVTEILEKWDEEDLRERRVVTLDAAQGCIRKKLRKVLNKATRLLKSD